MVHESLKKIEGVLESRGQESMPVTGKTAGKDPWMANVGHIAPALPAKILPPNLGKKSQKPIPVQYHQLKYLFPRTPRSPIKRMGKPTEISRAERKAKKRTLEDAIPNLPGDNEGEIERESISKAEKKSKKRKRDAETGDEVIGEGKESKKDKKKKKRKIEDGESEPAEEEIVQNGKKSKKEKKGKKTGFEKEGPVSPADIEVDTVMQEEVEAPKKTKKERKAERKAREAAESTSKNPAPTETSEAVSEANGKTEAAGEEKKSKKNNRNREKKRKGTSANGETSQPESTKPARFIVFIGIFLPCPSYASSTNPWIR